MGELHSTDIPIGKYMRARWIAHLLGWIVLDRGGRPLGHVEWFGRWRSYAFIPEANTVYSSGCARDLATFLDAQTAAKKAS